MVEDTHLRELVDFVAEVMSASIEALQSFPEGYVPARERVTCSADASLMQQFDVRDILAEAERAGFSRREDAGAPPANERFLENFARRQRAKGRADPGELWRHPGRDAAVPLRGLASTRTLVALCRRPRSTKEAGVGDRCSGETSDPVGFCGKAAMLRAAPPQR